MHALQVHDVQCVRVSTRVCVCLFGYRHYCQKDDLNRVRIREWRWGSNQQQKCIPFNDQPPLNLFSHEGAKGCSKIWRADCWWKRLYFGGIAQPMQIFSAIFFQLVLSVLTWLNDEDFISQTTQVRWWFLTKLLQSRNSGSGDTCQNI